MSRAAMATRTRGCIGWWRHDSLLRRRAGDAVARRLAGGPLTLPDQSVDCCVTSPPYFGLRDYGEAGQYGLEASPAEYVETMRAVFAEVRRVLADDGTLWLNIGDSYSSPIMHNDRAHKSTVQGRATRRREFDGQRDGTHQASDDRPHKNLLGIPWRTAFALQDDGWILRNDIIWSKPNAMPESVTDRLSTRHEHLFMLSKSPRYWFDLDPIREQLLHPDKTGHVFGGNHPELSRTRGSVYKVSKRDSFARAHQRGRCARPVHCATPRGSTGCGRRIPLGRNPGDVWTLPTQPFTEAHFAVMPQPSPSAPSSPVASRAAPCSTRSAAPAPRSVRRLDLSGRQARFAQVRRHRPAAPTTSTWSRLRTTAPAHSRQPLVLEAAARAAIT
jgi:hypothetical protein